ncbi:MAG TPA: hypothetical protein VMR23_13700 [Candidatus Limnocylindria bacterium]|nr:hypothetical protein [Candidatus Limnocylindria bacterium]
MTTDDEFESWFDKGVTDGLPVVPPTRQRVERMLAGTTRGAHELLGEMPPNYGPLTVEKAAINAVMAGCRPDYLPVVIAAAECACDPDFNLHGVSTSTHFSAPLIVVNGPIRARIGLNASFGVFGPGYRANATIGRALRLLMINIGGVRPGELSMSTFGHPGRYTYCIAEHEEASPWPPYAVSRGLPPGASAVTLFAGDAPHGISDHASRTARSLAGSLGWSMAGLWNSKTFPLYSHTMLVVGPEHARTFGEEGWSRADLARHLCRTIRVPYGSLAPDADHGEGTNLRFKTPPPPESMISKFASEEEIHVVVAGGTAGRFSAAIPGWLGTKNGSRPLTREIIC